MSEKHTGGCLAGVTLVDCTCAESSYRRGYQDGYEAAEAAANRAWVSASTWRPGLAEADRYVTVDGKRERVLSWRDRQAADLATLTEAHAAGLHDAGQARSRCPLCADGVYDRVTGVPVCSHGDDRMACQLAHGPSELHHRGDYGVPGFEDERPMHYCADNSRTACGKFAGMVYQFAATWENVTCTKCRDTIKPNYGVSTARDCRNRDHEHFPGDPLLPDCDAPPDPCAGGCCDPAAHAEGAHDV